MGGLGGHGAGVADFTPALTHVGEPTCKLYVSLRIIAKQDALFEQKQLMHWLGYPHARARPPMGVNVYGSEQKAGSEVET